jgi:alpha-mannosidase
MAMIVLLEIHPVKKLTFHLIGNAHLDPVWLWDWREGLNEGIITCRTILDLMDEFDDLTFIRGEAAIYRHIEQNDPRTFRRILRQVEAGRWDVVGGTIIQPDTNLPAAETFARHFALGQNYFQSRFGKPVRVAWSADSFGHCAGLPGIMAAAGITGYAFTRPSPEVRPIAKPAFWWEAASGERVLTYRPFGKWYGTSRNDTRDRLDENLVVAAKYDLENVGIFYGLGDHGGGPCRQQLRDINQWAAEHPDVRVIHSGLHRLLDAIRAEDRDLPVIRGELNYVSRGCYTTAARFKFAYRKTESALAATERTDAAISGALRRPVANLDGAWDALLFNTFHDILPGTSIERAFDDQFAWLGGAMHEAQHTGLAALNALAAQVETRVTRPPADHPSASAMLVWNPLPRPYRGHIELEANLDYRGIAAYYGRRAELPVRVLGPAGEALPFQKIPNENIYEKEDFFWRQRVLLPVELPAMGWSVFEFGWVEGAAPPPVRSRVAAPSPGVIENGIYRVQARKGAKGVEIFRKGKSIFGGSGLSAILVEDKGGAWGDPAHDQGLSKVLEHWRVTAIETIERGPQRATLWVRLAGRRSRIDLTFHLYRERDAVDVDARVFWDQRWARLKLVMPVGAREAEFEVPGATVRRRGPGEVPGGRWVRVSGKTGRLGFASDALYGFDLHDGDFRASVVRASAHTQPTAPQEVPVWRPIIDSGELKFRFLLNPGGSDLPALAQELEFPPVNILTAAKPGKLPRSGSLAALEPHSLQLLALKKAEDGRGLILRVQETAGKSTPATLTWLGKKIPLGSVRPHAIATWRLQRSRTGWKAARTGIVEDHLPT